MIIKILGTGCKKCLELKKNVETVVKDLGIDATIEKIEDIDKILEYNVFLTPGLVIDDEVVSYGKLLNVKQLKKMIERK